MPALGRKQGLGVVCDCCKIRDLHSRLVSVGSAFPEVLPPTQAGLKLAVAGQVKLQLLILLTPPPGAGAGSAYLACCLYFQ